MPSRAGKSAFKISNFCAGIFRPRDRKLPSRRSTPKEISEIRLRRVSEHLDRIANLFEIVFQLGSLYRTQLEPERGENCFAIAFLASR